MVDTEDSKSSTGDCIRVQVPSPVYYYNRQTFLFSLIPSLFLQLNSCVKLLCVPYETSKRWNLLG